MAEVAQNETSNKSTDTSKAKPPSSSTLKQSKIGFVPRKKITPTLVKTPNKKVLYSKANDMSKTSNSPSKKSETEKSPVSKSGKSEENGVCLQNGKRTPKKVIEISESVSSKNSANPLSPKVSLVQVNIDNINLPDSKTEKSKSKTGKEVVNKDKTNSNLPSTTKSMITAKNSETKGKTSSEVIKKTDKSKVEVIEIATTPTKPTATGAPKKSNSRLIGATATNAHAPVEITSSDSEEEEIPLSKLKSKLMNPFCESQLKNRLASPVNSAKSFPMNSLPKSVPKSVVVKPTAHPMKPASSGKLNQTIESLYNRNKEINGPMKTVTVVPSKPAPPPLNPISTKNIIIAIDMDPQKWKSLSPQEQTRIIEHKKELARKHLIAINNQKKAPAAPVYGHNLNKYNHSPVTPPNVMNIHPRKLTTILTTQNQVNYLNKSNTVITPTGTMHIPGSPHLSKQMNLHSAYPPKTYSINQTAMQQQHQTMLKQYYYPPRPPTFPTHMSSQMGQRVPIPNMAAQNISDFNQRFFQYNQRQDESSLSNLQPLPLSKKIPMPRGMPNELFGDIAMIVEFVNTFKSLLMQDTKITSEMLMAGVSPGSEQADTVAHILLLFLKILLSNEDYKVRGLKMELADLPLTEFTVSFLVSQLIKSQLETKKRIKKEKEFADKAARAAEKISKLNLPSKNSENSGSDSDYAPNEVDAIFLDDDEDDDDEEYGNKKKKKAKAKDFEEDSIEFKLNLISVLLESREFYMLATADQLAVLTYLLDLIIDSEDLSDYYDTISDDKLQAYRGIESAREEQKKIKAKIKQDQVITLDQYTKKGVNGKGDADSDTKKEVHGKVDVDSGTKNDNAASEIAKDPEEKTEESKEESNPYAGMTQRQIEAINSEKEKERNREKLKEESFKIEQQKCMEQLNKILELGKRVMRVEPLGEDRFRRLYWFFSEGIPGLYVSSGSPVDPAASHLLGIDQMKENWTYYNKEEDINQLLGALSVRGVREEKLKTRIRGKHAEIVASMKAIKDAEQLKEEKEKKANAKKERKAMKLLEHKETEQGEQKTGNKEEEKKGSQGGGGIQSEGEETESKEDGKIESKEEEKMEGKQAEKTEGKEEEKVKGKEEEKAEGKEEEKVQDKEEEKVEGKEEEKTEGKEEEKTEGKEEGKTGNKEEEDMEMKKEGATESKGEGKTEESKDTAIIEIIDDAEAITIEQEKKQENAEGDKLDADKENGDKGDGDSDNSDEEQVPYDAHKSSIEALKADIIESANRIVHGSLGELTELEAWTARVSSVNDVNGLKEFVLQIQSCIFPRFFLSPFKATAEDISKEWCKWVEKADTLSTMHLLYGIIENSIKWESSAEKMRCKVCRRKKGNTTIEQIIVCDGCHLGYHSHCLRPPLDYIPEGDWKCPCCLPKEERYKPKGKTRRYKAEEEQDDEEKDASSANENEETDHEELCHICESDGMMILCDTCPLSYHLECHKPPLHHAPRGNWSCFECLNPRKKKTAQRNTRVAQKSKYVESTDSNDEDSDNQGSEYSSSEDEFQAPKKTIPKGKKNKVTETNTGKANQKKSSTRKTQRKKRTAQTSTSNDDEEDESSQASEQEKEPLTGKFQRKKRAAQTSSSNDDKEDEASEQEVELPKGKSQRKKRTAQTSSSNDDKEDEASEQEVEPPKGKSQRKKRRVQTSSSNNDEEDEESSQASEEEEEPRKGRRAKVVVKKSKAGNSLKSNRTSKKNKNKKVSSDNDDEGNNNLRSKIKINYRIKNKKRPKIDESENDESGTEDKSESDNGDNEKWEDTHISPTLGNKRPRYAKDGLRGKKAAKEKEASTLESKDQSDKSDEEKSPEVLRNLSSADRSFRQAGRNSRRGCNYEMQACRNILLGLKKHKDSWPFLTPVNLKKTPDYLDVVEKPMDFSVMLKRLDDYLYDDVLQFIDDIKLVFDNSKKYNKDESDVGQAGIRLYEEFQNLLKSNLPEMYATFE